MRKYKIGDKVLLRDDSKHHGQSGDTVGTIKEFLNSYEHLSTGDESTYYFRIRWGNDHENTYRLIDIKLADDEEFDIAPHQYYRVQDSGYSGYIFIQTTSEYKMEPDGHLRGTGIGVNFSNQLALESKSQSFSIYKKGQRSFEPMTNRQIVWLNRRIQGLTAVDYNSWRPLPTDQLFIEILDKYGPLYPGKIIGDQTVVSPHPRDWTIINDDVYLAPVGEGGVRISKKSLKVLSEDDSEAMVQDSNIVEGDLVEVIRIDPTTKEWEGVGKVSIPFKIGDVLRVGSIGLHRKSLSFKGYKTSNNFPHQLFRKIDIVNKYLRVLIDDIYYSQLKAGQVVKIHKVDDKSIYTDGGWALPKIAFNKGEIELVHEEPFKLPDKWCVESDYSGKMFPELRKWRKGGGEWVGHGFIDQNGYWSRSIPPGYKVITRQQFIDHVYKKSSLYDKKPSCVIPASEEDVIMPGVEIHNTVEKKPTKTSFVEEVKQIEYKVKPKIKKRLTI